MGPRGEDLTRLTNDPASDNDPDWSPDGTQIAFVRNGDIFVMKADGSDQINLTNTLPPMVEEFPTWSPDGNQIAFDSNRDDPFGTSLYVMNADGSAPVRITTPAPANDISPAWSSLGTIAFERSQAEGSAPPIGDIYLVNPDGSGLTNLTTSPAEYHTPAWSPDGTRLAFAEILPDPTVQNSEIFAINSDGSGRVNLTNHPAYDFDPSWSADGGSIVFTSGRVTSPYNYDIINMEIDGSHQRNLTRKESGGRCDA